jgi:hypothetical protein
VVVGLTVPIKGDTANLDAALQKSGGGVKGFGDVLGGVSPVALGAAGAVVVAGKAIIDMTAAAAEDRDEQAKLELAIQAAGAATATSTQQVEDAIAAGQDRAFTDSETRDALTSLVTATGDVTSATGLLTDAQDIARFAGVDLATASDAVAKAQAGQDGALRKLVPGLAKGAKATDTIALASTRAAGQADLYAESSAGMGARASDAFAEIGETIGGAFLPVLDEVLPALLPVLKSLAQLVSTILPLIIPLIKALAAALSIVATVLSTVVGWIVKLVSWLARAIDKIGTFLEKINPLKNLKLPSLPFLNASGTGASPAGASTRGAPAGGSSSAGVIVNVYGALDPEATARQIRRILAGHIARTGAGVAI